MDYRWCFIVVNYLSFIIAVSQAMRITTRTNLIPEETKRLKRGVDDIPQIHVDDYNQNYNNNLTWNDVRWAEFDISKHPLFNKSVDIQLDLSDLNLGDADMKKNCR
ncbi:hypothetical protein ILUMI_04493 [Ignelater luminosus]|uniref:Uncharacterized protein n=1 Tax=Ignelater luminosus TaxID=2038154 RepID=A0A8K0GEH7_IGNLU|nr:hypothetical protein ILUMI_04493 [Ignelater luminosus]